MSSRKCPQCGLVNWADAEACKRCALNFVELDQPQPADWRGPEEEQSSSGPYGYYTYAQPAEPKRTGMALASLILGGVGFMTLGILGVGAVVGLIMGIVALKRARKHPALYGGEGYAIAGIVLNAISVVSVAMIMMIAAISIPNLLASRRAANEAAVLASLRKIGSAQATYYSTLGGSRQYGTLQDLARNGLLEESLASGKKYGYRFELRLGAGSFEVAATPLTYGRTSSPGTRSFYLSSKDGYVIHGADKKGLEADAYDPPVKPSNNVYTRRSQKDEDDPDYIQEY